jgi:hypothetical protein
VRSHQGLPAEDLQGINLSQGTKVLGLLILVDLPARYVERSRGAVLPSRVNEALGGYAGSRLNEVRLALDNVTDDSVSYRHNTLETFGRLGATRQDETGRNQS